MIQSHSQVFLINDLSDLIICKPLQFTLQNNILTCFKMSTASAITIWMDMHALHQDCDFVFLISFKLKSKNLNMNAVLKSI